MSAIWEDEEKRVREHFSIPPEYKLYCAGNSADVLVNGIEGIPDSEHLDSADIIKLVSEVKSPIGFMVCLFANNANDHIIVTPKSSVFSGVESPPRPPFTQENA